MPANAAVKDVDDVRRVVGTQNIVAVVDQNTAPIAPVIPREESERSEETVSAETLLSLNSLISPACDTPKLPDSALYGVIGDLVRRIEPHTEAHPAALLIQFLTGLGSIFGRSPYFLADSAKHHANLFAVVVGQSSRSRKGTSWNH